MSSTIQSWTPDQEAALLRAVIKYKPVGMHRHFRMIAIHNYLLNSGVVSPEEKHTSIPGIWEKLEDLYNLPPLDEREDMTVTGEDSENASGSSPETADFPEAEYFHAFDLPQRDYGEIMFDRRLADDPSDDGEGDRDAELNRRESTVADTDEPRSSPVMGGAGRRSGRNNNAKASAMRGRVSKLASEAQTSRRTSKAPSMADDDTLDGMELEDEADDHKSETAEGSDQDDEKKKGTRASTRSAKRPRRR